MIASILPRALVSAGLSSFGTIMLAGLMSRLSGRSAAGPVNAVGSHVAGEHAAWRRDVALQFTLPGVLLNLGGCLFWAGVVEWWVHERPLTGAPDAVARGAVAAALAYTVDYHVIPRELRPGYERKLSGPQLLALYALLSITFPLRALSSAAGLAPARRSRMRPPSRLVAGIPIG
jgi:hypothetical protein